MAAPINAADLEKLKKFIEFVAANPFVLNLPQLEFMKKFIEKFGGKVPEGEFQMPSGGKCPFGGAGDATKSETKETEAEDEKPAEMDVESEESDVELDMEENHNFNILQPNVVYLQEKTPKIVKKLKATEIRAKEKKKQTQKAKTTTKELKNAKSKAEKSKLTNKKQMQQEIELKSKYDPLFTSEVIIKLECPEEEIVEANKLDEQNKLLAGGGAVDLSKTEINLNIKHEFDAEAENVAINLIKSKESKAEQEQHHNESEDEDDNDDEEEGDDDFSHDEDDYKCSDYEQDDDDEPLIMLKKSRRRQKTYDNERIPRNKPCSSKCKRGCTEKLNPLQRLRICDHFWSLQPKQKRYEYLRRFIKKLPLRRIRAQFSQSQRRTCNYYLQEIPFAEVKSEPLIEPIRVCRTYFKATLSLSDHTLSQAIQNGELEMEDLSRFAKTIDKEKQNEKNQYLDPATGTLINLSSKRKIPQPTDCGAAKKKPCRYGDPEPERFPKPIHCAIRCPYKCHLKFTEAERKHICDMFWFMDQKLRKDFILSCRETREVEELTAPEFRISNKAARSFSTRFYMRSVINDTNERVCKNFLCATLAISKKFFDNVVKYADREEPVSKKNQDEHIVPVLQHINSYATWLPPNKKSKKRYLHYDLSIKRIYNEYKQKCIEQNKHFVTDRYFYKKFNSEFHLNFLTNPEPKKRRGCIDLNPNISDYTGEEPGGIWYHPNGEELDMTLYKPDKYISDCVYMPNGFTVVKTQSQSAADCDLQSTLDGTATSSSSSNTTTQQQQLLNLAILSSQTTTTQW